MEAKLTLSGDSSGLLKAIGDAEKSVRRLSNEFRSLQTTAVGALQFAGIGLGAAEIIKLADTYGQMTGKLKLATQYSGDFNEVQKLIRESAKTSRSDLGGTVELYTQLSPALKGLGLSAKDSVGVLTTIGQAVALSGASAESAQAALMQLGQGFASGALRGEELNSIMEQTPALAQAMADGLGVSRGELRQLGADGKLTAEAVAKALQKVAADVENDFKSLPVSVGQAMTNLRNEFMVFVGATDSASGGTSVLANTINAVADEFNQAGPAVTAFSELIKIMINGLDGSYRILKIVGTGLAGYAAALAALLSGEPTKAKAIWDELGKQIVDVLNKPLLTEPKVVASTTNFAKKRLDLETQLAAEKRKLIELVEYAEGKSQNNILSKDKETVDNRIKEQQRLVDAVRAAWQQTIDDADKFAQSAKDKTQKGVDAKQSGKDVAERIRDQNRTPEEIQQRKTTQLTDLQGEASTLAAQARMAAIEGNSKKFDKLTDTAEKKLQAALKLAEDVKDATAAEDIGKQLESLYNAAAGVDQKKSDDLKTRAAEQAKMINDLQAQITVLEQAARSIEVTVAVDTATTAIKGLQNQLAELKDKTVTVTVQTVTASQDAAGTPALAGGGMLRGPGTGTSDSILARVSNGEYVVRAAAVNHYGANLLNRINSMSIPRFAGGGQVGGRAGSTVNLSLNGSNYAMSATQDVAAALTDAVRREALKKGGRR